MTKSISYLQSINQILNVCLFIEIKFIILSVTKSEKTAERQNVKP